MSSGYSVSFYHVVALNRTTGYGPKTWQMCQVNLITFTFWVIDMPLNCFFGIHLHGIVELRPSVLCRQLGCRVDDEGCKVYGEHSPIFPHLWHGFIQKCTVLHSYFTSDPAIGFPCWPQDISFYLVWCGCFDHLH